MTQDEEFKQQIQANDVGESAAEVEHINDPNEPDFDSMPIEQVNQYLREHGYDPEKIRLRSKILTEALVKNIIARDIIQRFLNNEGGCRFCDYGVLRKPGIPEKGHDEDCLYLAARAYLDNEISADVKNPENKPAYNENANSLLRSAWMIANRNGEQINWEAFKDRVYEELVREHEIKTSTDNNKRSKWKAYVPGWGAPAVNKRYLVKLINDWITIATYYLRVGGGYWKDDRGQELADGVVSLWKGLEE